MPSKKISASIQEAMRISWLDFSTPLVVSAHRLGVSAGSMVNLAKKEGLPHRPRGRTKEQHYDYKNKIEEAAPRTERGQRLLVLRKRIVDSGTNLLSLDEINLKEEK